MRRFHQQRQAQATLLLHQRTRSNSIGSLDEQKRITNFLERPTEEARRGVQSLWVNSGVCICQPQLLTQIPADTTCDLPRDIFPKLIGSGERLYGYPLSGYRCAIDSPERLAEAQLAIANQHCRIELPEQISSRQSPKTDVQSSGN